MSIHFFNIQSLKRQRLILFGIILIYSTFLMAVTLQNDLFLNKGADFFSFWTVGRIANNQGYMHIYDIKALKQTQDTICVQEKLQRPTSLNPIPAPFLPVFIPLFQFFALFPVRIGFFLWTIFNLLLFVWYLYFFSKRLFSTAIPAWLTFLLLFSLPVFLTFYWGQLNVLLFIATGEFLRAIYDKEYIRAGAWLSLFLIKPQLLILMIPALFLYKHWEILKGFTISALVLFALSFSMIKLSGFSQLLALWFGYARGLPSNAPEIMMNWRMLGLRLGIFLPPTFSRTVVIVGMGLTFFAGLWIGQYFLRSGIQSSFISVLGLLAATCVTTWHAHVHMGIVLLPPLLFLLFNGTLPSKLFYFWLFSLPLSFISYLILVQFPIIEPAVEGSLPGFLTFIIYTIFLGWAIFVLRKKNQNILSSEKQLPQE